tara:strand:+ start:3100 stop:4950 length:1851 start_codon:yes stop_codon:yes gene_type:complete
MIENGDKKDKNTDIEMGIKYDISNNISYEEINNLVEDTNSSKNSNSSESKEEEDDDNEIKITQVFDNSPVFFNNKSHTYYYSSDEESIDSTFINNEKKNYNYGSNSDEGTVMNYRINSYSEKKNKDHYDNNEISEIKLKTILACTHWKKKDMYEVKNKIEEHFTNDLVTLTSNHLDIIASYLNSQKIIYIEASHVTSNYLNCLMIPTIVISASASVLSGAGERLVYNQLIISCITAFGAFLLAIINYLKLDAASEAHKISSHQYDKLQSHIMFLSGETLLFSPASFSMHTYRDKIAKKTAEVKMKSLQSKETCCDTKSTAYAAAKEKFYDRLKSIEEKKNKDDLDPEKLKSLRKEEKSIAKELLRLKKNYQSDLKKCNDMAEQQREVLLSQERVNIDKNEEEMQGKLIEDTRKQITSIQDKIKEIKETNHFEVPESIRHRFPVSYGINVFSIIKSLDDFKVTLIHQLWVIKNDLRCCDAYIRKCYQILENNGLSNSSINVIEKQLQKLISYKSKSYSNMKKTYEAIIGLKTAYVEIDSLFQNELLNDKMKRKYWCYDILIFPFVLCCPYTKKYKPKTFKDSIIYKILYNKDTILSDKICSKIGKNCNDIENNILNL